MAPDLNAHSQDLNPGSLDLNLTALLLSHLPRLNADVIIYHHMCFINIETQKRQGFEHRTSGFETDRSTIEPSNNIKMEQLFSLIM